MTQLPVVEQLDMSQWQPHEYPLAFYFVNFARLVGAVNTEPGPLQGWFSEPVWRQYSYAPFNARVMENYYSLAFFYGYNAPWNCYYRHPEVLRRLELALRYTFGLQDARGALPEYAPADVDTPMLAPSSFGSEYLAKSLEVAGEVLPLALRGQLAAAARAAARFVLSSEEAWTHAHSYSNQCFAAMAALEVAQRIDGDTSFEPLVERGLAALLDGLIADPGYLYEADGPDTFGYFFVSMTRLVPLYHERPDPRILEVLRRQCAWMRQWMLPEPDGMTILCAGSHQTRTAGRELLVLDADAGLETAWKHAAGGSWPWLAHGVGRVLADAGPEADTLKLFFPPAESLERWQQQWGAADDLAARCFKPCGEYHPTPTQYALPVYAAPLAELQAARDALPVLDPTVRLSEQRDARGNQYVLARQEGYAAGFAFAEQRNAATLGPSHLWTPAGGTLILSRNTGRAGWETVVGSATTAKTTGLATVREEDAGPELLIAYPELGIEKFFSLRPHSLIVRVSPDVARGHALGERIPLLLHEQDVIHCEYGRCPVGGIYELTNGWKLITQRLFIERAGVPLIAFDFHHPTPVVLKSRAAFVPGALSQVHAVAETATVPGPRRADVELTFRYSSAFYGRSGYRIDLGEAAQRI